MSEWSKERVAETRRMLEEGTIPFVMGMATAALPSLLDALESVPRWIAVTPETMPPKNTTVLVNSRRQLAANSIFCAQWNGKYWMSIPGVWSHQASHWMHLPAPPVLP